MSNELNNKEKQFKDLAEGLDFKLDTDALWSGLSKELHEKKKRRIGWLPMLSVGFLVLLGIVLFSTRYASSSSEEVVIYSNDIIQNSPQKSDIPKNKSNSETVNNYQNTSPQENITSKIRTETEQRNEVAYSSSIQTRLSKDDISKTKQTITTDAEILAQVKENNIKRIGQVQKSHLINTEDKQNKPRPSLGIISTIHALPMRTTINFTDREFSFDRIENSISPVRIDNWKYFAALHFGLNHNISNNAIRNNSENLYPAILQSENDKAGFNAEFRLGTEHVSGWRLSGGLSYSTFFSAIDSETINTVSTTVPGTELIIINPDGTQTLVEGELGQTTSTTTSFLWHRRHKRINAQIHLGKSLFKLNNITLGMETGLRYNLWADDVGYYFDQNLAFTKLPKGEESPYAERHGLGIQTGIHLEYRMGAFAMGLYPHFVYNPNSISKASHIYSSTNHQAGMNASFYYLLDY